MTPAQREELNRAGGAPFLREVGTGQWKFEELSAEFMLALEKCSEFREAGDFAQVRATIEEAVRAEGLSVAAHFVALMIYAGINDRPGVIRHASAGLRLEPNSPALLKPLGTALAELAELSDGHLEDLTAAIEALLHSRAERPDASTSAELSICYALQGEANLALQFLVEASEAVASDDFVVEQMRCALRHLEVADLLSLRASHPAAAYLLVGLKADTTRRLDMISSKSASAPLFDRDFENEGTDTKAALDAFEAAAKIDAKGFQARYHSGLLLSELGRHDQAVARFTEALELFPNHLKARLARASSYVILKDYKFAVGDYAPVLNQVVQAKLKLGESLPAIQATDDLQTRICVGMAYCFAKQGDFSGAIAGFGHALEAAVHNRVAAYYITYHLTMATNAQYYIDSISNASLYHPVIEGDNSDYLQGDIEDIARAISGRFKSAKRSQFIRRVLSAAAEAEEPAQFIPEGYKPYSRKTGSAIEHLRHWWTPHVKAGTITSRQQIRDVDEQLMVVAYAEARESGVSLDDMLPPSRKADTSKLSGDEYRERVRGSAKARMKRVRSAQP